jgi:hypothetical protein
METFSTWDALLTHIRAGGAVAYQAPLDVRPIRVRVVAQSGGRLRVYPPTSDADPFTADPGHLPRFRRADPAPIQYLEPGTYEFSERILPWQAAGLQQTASGYGRKLTSRRILRIVGEKVWRRVYYVCFSNAGSSYVLIKGRPFYLKGNG